MFVLVQRLPSCLCVCVRKRQYLRELVVLDWCVPPALPFLLRMATLPCLMMPHPSWSVERYAGRCVCSLCVHKASISGATAQHPTPTLITLYLAPSMCVSVCECESEGSYAPINIKYRYPCQWITSSDPISSSQGGEVRREMRWEVKEGRDKVSRRTGGERRKRKVRKGADGRSCFLKIFN